MVAERIRTAIMTGVFEPGVQLHEASLAESLHVSRGPVREAMQRLIQEGLLRSRPHRGVFVAELTVTDIADVYLARLAVEGAAAAEIIRKASRGLLDAARAHLDQMRAAAKRGRWEAVVDLDLGFHQLLVDAAESQRLSRMFSTLIVETRLCLARLDTTYPVLDELVDEHAELLALLETRDLGAFLAALEVHFHAAVDSLSSSAPPEAGR